jgi:hypothetical protein
VSQVTRKWTGSAEEHLVIPWITKGRTDNRNPPRRFHEVSRVVGSPRGAEKLQCKCGKNSKLRRDKGSLMRVTRTIGFTRIS